MKYIPLILFFALSLCFGQKVKKHYLFDHLLEYEYREELNSSPKTVYYLTNSKSDNFYIKAENRKEIGDSLLVDFIDFNGKSSSFHISKEDFFLENFLLDCKIVLNTRYRNSINFKNYHVVREKDTILEKQEHQVFIIKNENGKREKRRKECRFHYVMKKKTEHLFAAGPLIGVRGKWKNEISLPNGIPLLYYHSNGFQEDHHFHKLKNISGINKELKIIGNCK